MLPTTFSSYISLPTGFDPSSFDESPSGEETYKYSYSYNTSMSTTIQLKDVTKQRLDILKEKYAAASYDEVVSRMTERELSTPKSMFGSLKGTKPFTKADRLRFRYE